MTSNLFFHISNVACAVAGLTADANILINNARIYAERYRYTYNQDMPLQQMVDEICNLKQGYTQFGGTTSPLLIPSRLPLTNLFPQV
jgi:20S proteasome alpha/beta subunit